MGFGGLNHTEDHDDSELLRLRAERGRAEELHYAVRNTANILDKKTPEEAHVEAMQIVAKMRAVWAAAHEVDKTFSRDAPMMLIAPGAVAEQKLEALRSVLDRPVSSFPSSK